MNALNGLLILVALALIFLAAIFIAEKIAKFHLWYFTRRVRSKSLAKRIELALRLGKKQAYAEAVVAQIDDSDALLRIGREARSDLVQEAAQARHCLLFGHQLDDKCYCSVCKQESHDFRDGQGRTPSETTDFGAYSCTRCNAVFYREYVPGCKDTCTTIDCFDGDGKIERYSSQSGQGGSWCEDCGHYAPPGVHEEIRYEHPSSDGKQGKAQ